MIDSLLGPSPGNDLVSSGVGSTSSDDRPASSGCIDSYGYSQAAGAWVTVGWMPRCPANVQECDITLHFARVAVSGRCFRASFSRNDLTSDCEGVVILSPRSGRNLGRLVYIEVDVGGSLGAVRLLATEQVEQLPDGQIAARARSVLSGAARDPAQLAILKLLSRQGYPGRSTLHEIGAPIFMAVDEAIRCGDAGLVLIGWLAAERRALRRLHLRTGAKEVEIDLDRALRVKRDDAGEALARDHGLHELNAGFVLFIAGITELDEHAHLQIEAADLSVGYLSLPAPKLRGVAAMRRILETFSLRYDEMVRAYDRVVGPALTGLNRDRLRGGVDADLFNFGSASAAPVCSVIVPLYGRIDFMEYQLALFSRERRNWSHEFIYVLDDPTQKVALLSLAETCAARFGLPFRVLVLDRNVGYAPASNAGLRFARGKYTCFLNSDVFPGDDPWIDRLIARLEENPKLGAVGPVLLFEDGTVQHRGLEYEPLPEFGNWLFPMHPGKGMRPPRRRGLELQRAITGACLMMRSQTAQACGGFDESYAIGDFEDSDLCLRIGGLGLTCGVDLDLRLYHLERQSQGDMTSEWRFNLTLFNAWTHQNRWCGELDAMHERLAAD